MTEYEYRPVRQKVFTGSKDPWINSRGEEDEPQSIRSKVYSKIGYAKSAITYKKNYEGDDEEGILRELEHYKEDDFLYEREYHIQELEELLRRPWQWHYSIQRRPISEWETI